MVAGRTDPRGMIRACTRTARRLFVRLLWSRAPHGLPTDSLPKRACHALHSLSPQAVAQQYHCLPNTGWGLGAQPLQAAREARRVQARCCASARRRIEQVHASDADEARPVQRKRTTCLVTIARLACDVALPPWPTWYGAIDGGYSCNMGRRQSDREA